MDSATKEDRVHPEKDFCNEYNPYLSTDDQIYKRGLVAYTCNQKDWASLAMPHNDRALWHLINLGHARRRQAVGCFNTFHVLHDLPGRPLVGHVR